jgi:repressor LexA
MTDAQLKVYRWVKEFMREHGWAPTRVEIAKGLHFASPNAADHHVRALAKVGALRAGVGGARKIVLNTEYRGRS